MILGIDTSCYTTSVSLCSKGKIIADLRRPLRVKEGTRGLRQSDGVFMHIKALPELMEQLAQENDMSEVRAVAVSCAPCPGEGSYMPVFMAGLAVAKSVAAAKGVPLYKTSHQEGHIMAALETCGEQVTDNELVAVHISGGTTDLLRTKRTNSGFELSLAASSLDLHAGQLVDRVGVAMGMRFPCGAELDFLALTAEKAEKLPVTMKGCDFHLSGAETKAVQLLEKGADKAALAKGVLETVAFSVNLSLDALYEQTAFSRVIIGGGVSASKVIRNTMKSDKYKILFADPKYSSDNACGVALIGDKLR